MQEPIIQSLDKKAMTEKQQVKDQIQCGWNSVNQNDPSKDEASMQAGLQTF